MTRLDQLFERPTVAKAEAALRRAVMAEAQCGAMRAVYAIRDRYKDLSEPRHPVTKWP